MIRVFDAFSGIGGFRSGLERVGGFKIVAWCEIDKFAQKAYKSLYDTNSEGYLITPEMLPCGEYSLVEVQAPYGYALDSTPLPFTISEDNAEEENAVRIVKLTKENTPQKGRISIQKSGDVFSSVTALGSAIYIDENGVEHESGQTTYTPVFEEKGLAGAVFQVIAGEDIVTADGTVRANVGDVVAEITTDENGYAQTDLLYLGKYEVKEISAPYGYVLNSEPQIAELTYAGQEVTVRDTVNTMFINDYQSVEISLEKLMENDERFNIHGKDSYTSVRFGLFAAEEITAADGNSIPENGFVAEVSLDENMTAVIAEKVPFGKYYVQEIATDEKYVLNGEKYLVSFEYIRKRLQAEKNEAVRKLLQADLDFLDEIQTEMSSARQFMFAIRFKREKPEQIFSIINRVDKAISEHGFSVRRMNKPEIKRMLALYFGTSISGDEISDIEGSENFEFGGN